jgi:hypothetical protein
VGKKLDYTPRGWTEEEIVLVKAFAGQGMSAADIARKLNGRTRNAVLGVMHRNGWTKEGRAALRVVHTIRPVPLKRAMACAQLSYETSINSVSLAGPAWSWPSNQSEAA